MSLYYPCGTISRRALLAGMSIPAIGSVKYVSASESRLVTDPLFDKTKLGAPGPFPGRVIEAKHASLRTAKKAAMRSSRPWPVV